MKITWTVVNVLEVTEKDILEMVEHAKATDIYDAVSYYLAKLDDEFYYNLTPEVRSKITKMVEARM